jgi:hypothetical protein
MASGRLASTTQRAFFEKSALEEYSVNNLTAQPNADGSYTVQFGGCQKNTINCLPSTPDWNYTVRLYRARKTPLDGTWRFPEAQPMHAEVRSAER